MVTRDIITQAEEGVCKMKKTRFLFIALFLILTINYSNKILAAEENTTASKEDEQKQEIIGLINDYLTYMDGKIEEIDKVVENARSQDEFAYYPAIRLNIDTPFFGVSSLAESKLRVKKEVSTTDIASQYSIRDIIKNKIIRLPESYLGSIVMSTKEYTIDEDMTLANARVTLVKCIQYVTQVDNAKSYVDTQINQTFRDYIKQDKKDALNDVKTKVQKCENDLEIVAEQIMKIRFVGKDVNDMISRYTTIATSVNDVNKLSKNTLISENNLVELNKKAIACESDVVTLKDDVQKMYDEAIKNMDYSIALQALYNNVSERQKVMKSFIDGSKRETISVVDGKEVKEEIVVYTITSASTLDYLDETIKDIEEDKKKYEESLKNTTTEVTQEDRIKDNKEKIDDIYDIYMDVVEREYKFYTNNINSLLKDSNSKIASIVSQLSLDIDIDNKVFEYIKYTYIELPTNLTNYLENNNLDSAVELNNLVKELRNEISDLAKKNYSITKLYDEITKKVSES